MGGGRREAPSVMSLWQKGFPPNEEILWWGRRRVEQEQGRGRARYVCPSCRAVAAPSEMWEGLETTQTDIPVFLEDSVTSTLTVAVSQLRHIRNIDGRMGELEMLDGWGAEGGEKGM